MEVIYTIQDLRCRLNDLRAQMDHKKGTKQSTFGFVPTMGFLHEGHASLLHRARQECDLVVLSIFVNPIQFGPGEDFDRYPRDTERDLAYARKAEVDIVFMPDVQEMYPRPTKTKVAVSELTDLLCGASRPEHFDGVSTVVSKLLHIVDPDFIYLGLKDVQQVAVLEQMVFDLNMRVKVVPCPIVREADGLAMSSRNVYLNAEERQQALILSQALQQSEQWLIELNGDPRQLEKRIRDFITAAPLANIDYVQVLAYPSLQLFTEAIELKNTSQQILVALAVKFGRTRLIDNRILS